MTVDSKKKTQSEYDSEEFNVGELDIGDEYLLE